MRIHYVQHASFEKVGVIERWAQDRGYSLRGTHVYAGDRLPEVDEFDFLIVMGGPQSPSEVDKYPYLKSEMELISTSIKAGKIVLGFCLGAQLIAEALGAKTEKSPEKEIGVYPIDLIAAGREDPLFVGFECKFDVIHWHNDMPGLPKGAELLARSAGCPRQGFRYGDRVYGFQFHMEITPEVANDLVANCPEDITPGNFVQTAETFLAHDFKPINEGMIQILDRLVRIN